MQTPTSEPAIVLVEPQLGENIGAAARAMANFGLGGPAAGQSARGLAERQGAGGGEPAPTMSSMGRGVFASLEEAISGLGFVFATTARAREVAKAVIGPHAAAARCRRLIAAGTPVGILFGRERTGLTNDEVALADEILTMPVEPRILVAQHRAGGVDLRLRMARCRASPARRRRCRSTARSSRRPTRRS